MTRPAGRHRALNEALLRRRIEGVMRRLGFRDVVTIVGTSFAARIAGSLGKGLDAGAAVGVPAAAGGGACAAGRSGVCHERAALGERACVEWPCVPFAPCAPASARGGRRGDMRYKLFAKVVDEAAGSGLYDLLMHQHGGPLMNERPSEMVQAAEACGIPVVNLTTNAILLDGPASRAHRGGARCAPRLVQRHDAGGLRGVAEHVGGTAGKRAGRTAGRIA